MAISTTGSFNNTFTTGTNTATITVANAGDLITMSLAIASGSTITPSTLTGSNGVGALQFSPAIYATNPGAGVRMFFGIAPNSGSVTLTPTFSTSVTTEPTQYDGWCFTAGLGSSTVWKVDTSNTSSDSGTATCNYPVLTAAGAGELYVGCTVPQGTGQLGATSGFTYNADTNFTNVFCRNTNASGTLSPTTTQISGSATISVAALITASLARPPAPFVSQYSSYH